MEVFIKWREKSEKENGLCQEGDIVGKLHRGEDI